MNHDKIKFSFHQLDESKHLPSPLCEKMEISKDFSSFLRPVALPPYMSAWELDVTNGSVPDYSLELVCIGLTLKPALRFQTSLLVKDAS